MLPTSSSSHWPAGGCVAAVGWPSRMSRACALSRSSTGIYTSPIQIWSRRNADTLNTIRKVSSASDTGSGAWEPDKLLALALSRPSEALVAAREVLAGHPSAAQAAVAHQAAGVVLKDFGNINQAIAEFKAARRFARRAGDLDREADVSASLGMTLVLSGQPRRGLSVLDTLLERSDGVLAGRILIRRVGAFYVLGRNAEALRDVQAARSEEHTSELQS